MVTNVSDTTQSGTVRLALPAGFTADRAEAGYSGPWRPGRRRPCRSPSPTPTPR
ncbi:hypothetical protein [Nonomuraea dietziae]|uniref:hypothetical protein n=1 Tax=Nonomuraea dietziae TaxID=65515 RepID=UPI0031DEBE0D